MQQQDGMKRDLVQDMKTGGNLLIFLVWAWALTHRALWSVPGTVGFRTFGVAALVGMVLPWGLLLFWGQNVQGGEYLIWYWWLLLAAYAIHRMATSYRLTRGAKIHSYFIGESWFEQMFPKWNTATAKGLMELLATVSLGCLLLAYCPPLGVFIMGGGFANAVALSLLQSRDERVVEEAINQEVNARYYAEKIRERMGQEE